MITILTTGKQTRQDDKKWNLVGGGLNYAVIHSNDYS